MRLFLKENGETALILASINGHIEVVKYFVSIGVNLESKDFNICIKAIIFAVKLH